MMVRIGIKVYAGFLYTALSNCQFSIKASSTSTTGKKSFVSMSKANLISESYYECNLNMWVEGEMRVFLPIAQIVKVTSML